MIKLQNSQQIIRLAPKPRKKHIISTSSHTNHTYAAAIRGKRSDTKELNINLKTITISFLRVANTENELSQYEQIIFERYMKMPANFSSLHYMFHESEGEADREKNQVEFIQARQKLRKMCLGYYRSTEFVKQFITSPRMHIKNKLVILKFLKKIEEKAGEGGQSGGWKNTGIKTYHI